MTLAASVWSIIFDSADREEAVRAALREALPTTGKKSTWSTIKVALQQHSEPDELESAMVGLRPAYPTSPAVEAENPFLSDSADLPGGGLMAALHVGGVR